MRQLLKVAIYQKPQILTAFQNPEPTQIYNQLSIKNF